MRPAVDKLASGIDMEGLHHNTAPLAVHVQDAQRLRSITRRSFGELPLRRLPNSPQQSQDEVFAVRLDQELAVLRLRDQQVAKLGLHRRVNVQLRLLDHDKAGAVSQGGRAALCA